MHQQRTRHKIMQNRNAWMYVGLSWTLMPSTRFNKTSPKKDPKYPRVSLHPSGRCQVTKLHILQTCQCHVVHHRHAALQGFSALVQLSTTAAQEAFQQGRTAAHHLTGLPTEFKEIAGPLESRNGLVVLFDLGYKFVLCWVP